MNRHYLAILGILTGLLSTAASAAPGEYWEITNKMEMPGMPFAMPATTAKVLHCQGQRKQSRKNSGDKRLQDDRHQDRRQQDFVESTLRP